jgi:hypothetical protein
MIKIIGLVVVVLIGAVLLFALTRPNTLHVERTTSINAPPDRIASLISDFHSWNAWSPYDKKDPAMKRSFSGAPAGKGAVYEWDGDSNVGQGRMEIADVSPSRVAIKLDFSRPIEGHNVATFTLQPEGNATRVTWAMDGPTRYITKLIGMFMNMDRMIGDDFAVGLSNLKTIAEQQR